MSFSRCAALTTGIVAHLGEWMLVATMDGYWPWILPVRVTARGNAGVEAIVSFSIDKIPVASFHGCENLPHLSNVDAFFQKLPHAGTEVVYSLGVIRIV